MRNPIQSAAIVTGGGRGIGKAISLRLIQDLPVIVVGRTKADLDSLCIECQGRDGVAVACVGDIADPATASAAVALAHSLGWTIRHLICNAGMGKSGSTEKFDPDLWKRIFDVNVHGCFHFVQACLPDLISIAGATITIVSSIAGVRGVSHDAAYSASKHALVGFARSLAMEYCKSGLTIAALCPSFIESEMTQRSIQGLMTRRGWTDLEAKQRIAQSCPAQRILPASEIAEAIALLGAGQFEAALELAERGGYPIFGNKGVERRNEK